ncbi:hypothetical protein ACH0BU_12545 [Sphingomonas olei]
MTIAAACLGFPHEAQHGDVAAAVEDYRAGRISAADLIDLVRRARAAAWERQRQAGIEVIPCNDFSFAGQLLDTSIMLGAVPERFRAAGEPGSLDLYVAMAGGFLEGEGAALPTVERAAGRARWFDSDHQRIVPEVSADQHFSLSTSNVLDAFNEAKALGYHCRPVILGPVTFLHLAQSREPGVEPLSLLHRLLPVYAELLLQLKLAGADWVQIDEPVLVLDSSPAVRAALRTTYWALAGRGAPKIMLASYFGAIGDNLDAALGLPVAGLHLDLVAAPGQLAQVMRGGRLDLVLSLGVVDGRGGEPAHLSAILDEVEPLVGKVTVQIAPSCSLAHAPVDEGLPVGARLVAAMQRLDEVATLRTALRGGRGRVQDYLQANAAVVAARRAATGVTGQAISNQTGESANSDATSRSSPPWKRIAPVD